MRTTFLRLSLTIGFVTAVSFAGQTQDRSARERKSVEAMSSISILVEPGEEPGALAYYNRIQTRLNFPLLDAAGTPTATLDQLIEFFGYAGLSAKDLEKIGSLELMPQTQAEFDKLSTIVDSKSSFLANLSLTSFQNSRVLSSRFFAPKIVNYSVAPPFIPGWRKLVRFLALPGSKADANGLAVVYILFNYVKADVVVDPFTDNISKNNQVIIVPKTFVTGSEDSAYFMVFLEAPAYRLGNALEGVAFDLPQLGGGGRYFVPVSCAQCHGHDAASGNRGPKPADGIYRFARLNYLDTDQWTDAMRFDFTALLPTANAVVFDGGQDQASELYKRAFGVVRTLNSDISRQNAAIDSSDFKAKAAQKWLDLHASSDVPVSQDKRALDTGGQVWNSTPGSDDQKLLTLMNRYCFRCHSSVRYNVFDKGGVADSSAGIGLRMRLDPSNKRFMPNGRILEPAERDALIELVDRLFP